MRNLVENDLEEGRLTTSREIWPRKERKNSPRQSIPLPKKNGIFQPDEQRCAVPVSGPFILDQRNQQEHVPLNRATESTEKPNLLLPLTRRPRVSQRELNALRDSTLGKPEPTMGRVSKRQRKPPQRYGQ